MEIIVPLAGPDFELPGGGTKAEVAMDGQPLLMRALMSRSWWRRGEASASDLVFVLRDTAHSRAFVERSLSGWFPNARKVFLSHPTAGAAFSVLAAVSLCKPEQVLCIDLADILYSDDFHPEDRFAADPRLGGMVPIFPSEWSLYSYVDISQDGCVIRTAEKSVISGYASAGTYFFRDASVYASAVAHAIRHREKQTYRGAYFVCPLFNGVIASGLDVRTCNVSEVVDIKKAVAE